MNKYEKKYLQMIANQVSIEGNFESIKDKIQIKESAYSSTNNVYSLLLRILMPCELITSFICLGLFFISHGKALPEGGFENDINIEVIYLLLSISFVFIFAVTFIVYQKMKKRKTEGKSKI